MPISLIIRNHEKDLGAGFKVRRLLPSAARQSIGPFLFFDHFGPVTQGPNDAMDVRPHPHIGLATVTYLFDGAIEHRDNLGNVQRIQPGAINWMTAGSGIVHSERTPVDLRQSVQKMHGLQLWAALPRELEEVEPNFFHTPANSIPELSRNDVCIRVLIGKAFGLRSPVETFTPTLYLHIDAQPGARLIFPADNNERAIYSIDEPIEVDGEVMQPHTVAVLDNAESELFFPHGARIVIIGGAPLDGHRFMWWNFVSTRKERIEQAKADWRAQRMGRIEGDSEFIPLPESAY